MLGRKTNSNVNFQRFLHDPQTKLRLLYLAFKVIRLWLQWEYPALPHICLQEEVLRPFAYRISFFQVTEHEQKQTAEGRICSACNIYPLLLNSFCCNLTIFKESLANPSNQLWYHSILQVWWHQTFYFVLVIWEVIKYSTPK